MSYQNSFQKKKKNGASTPKGANTLKRKDKNTFLYEARLCCVKIHTSDHRRVPSCTVRWYLGLCRDGAAASAWMPGLSRADTE